MLFNWRNALLLLFFGLLLPGAGLGETFTVTKTEDDDGPCMPEDCALREAILAANVLPGEDRILLPVGTYTLSIEGTAENESRTGDLDIRDDLVIEGGESRQVIIDGNSKDRVLDIFESTVTLKGLVIANGLTAFGGGILTSSSRLTILDSWITNNSAVGLSGGGGIFQGLGEMALINTTVSNNTTARDGGGIRRFGLARPNEANLTLVNSTVSGNRADAGGGIFSQNSGDLILVSSTIADNEAVLVDGLFFFESSPPTLFNTLIAGNCSYRRTRPPITNEANIESPGATCFLPDTGDRMNVPDAGLAPLGHYGGPTPTHALLAGSLAIDTANDAECEPNDQRGFARPQDGDGDGVARCDIGAVEFDPRADSVLPTAIPTLDRAALAALALLLAVAAGRLLRGVG